MSYYIYIFAQGLSAFRLSLQGSESACDNSSPGVQARTLSAQPKDPNYQGECESCPRLTSRTCSFCYKGLYCSEYCEEKRTNNHVFTCSKRPLISADYLYRS